MPYLGSAPATSFLSMTSQSFTGGSGTSFTLNKSVSTTSDIAVFVNNVRQSPVNSSYSVSGTTLTMSASIASSDNFYVVFLGSAVGTINPASGSVGTSQLADSSVSLAKLSATGTKDATTFLRGDNSFASAGVNPSSIAFHAHANANQSIPTSSYTTVTLPNEKVDTGSDFSSNTFTVPTTGFYFFVCRMTFLSGWTGQYITKIRLVRSSSEVDSLVGYHYHNNTEEGDGNSGVMSCQASDEISFQVYQASGSSRNTYYGNAGGIMLAGFFLGSGA